MNTIGFVVVVIFCWQQSSGQRATSQDTAAGAAKPAPEIEARSDKIDAEIAEKLLKVKRIYVESFGDDALSKSLQGMVANALSASKLFIVTENKEKADAVLKGAALEKTSQEFHALGEGTAVASAAGGHSSSISGSAVEGPRTFRVRVTADLRRGR